MIGPDEYLEKLALDSFKREIDRDEAIWRVMPFFATSLALVATVIWFAAGKLPKEARSPLFWFECAALGLSSILVMLAIWSTWQMGRARRFRYPPTDPDMQAYAHELEEFTQGLQKASAGSNQLIIHNLRLRVVQEFGQAAARNRDHNERRMAARSAAFAYTLGALVLVMIAVLAIFADARLMTPGP